MTMIFKSEVAMEKKSFQEKVQFGAFVLMFDEVIKAVRREYMLTDEEYEMWLEPLDSVLSDETTLFIRHVGLEEFSVKADRLRGQEYIKKRYFPLIKEQLKKRFGENFEVFFINEVEEFIAPKNILIERYAYAKDVSLKDEEEIIHRIKQMGHWYGICDRLIMDGNAKLSELIYSKESILRFLSKYNEMPGNAAEEIADSIWNKRKHFGFRFLANVKLELSIAGVPKWYVWYCEQIM